MSHTKISSKLSHKSVLLLEVGGYIDVQNFKRLTKASFIIFGDPECVFILSTDNIELGPNTKEYQDHIVMTTNSYVLMSDIVNHTKSYKDAIDKSLNDMIKEIKYFCKATETEYNIPLVVTKILKTL